eukprot:10504462-Alexandrium_andersonii.AAC.1
MRRCTSWLPRPGAREVGKQVCQLGASPREACRSEHQVSACGALARQDWKSGMCGLGAGEKRAQAQETDLGSGVAILVFFLGLFPHLEQLRFRRTIP